MNELIKLLTTSFQNFDFLTFLSDHLTGIGYGLMFLVAAVGIFKRSRKNRKAIKVLEKNIKASLNEPVTLHPEIDNALCAGCGSCVKACPEGEILQLIDHKAVLVSPTKCVGHGACEQSCPFGAIDLVFGTKTRGMEIPRISSDFETNIPGLYIAGELGGMGLIRNAIKQGKLAAHHAASKAKKLNIKTDYDLFIIGAGPAGFSAGLTAVELKSRYKLIEQNSFGGTIFNFPRQKIVTSHPLEMPIVGSKKFKRNTVSKEELLTLFSKIKKENNLIVSERENFTNLEQLPGGGFQIETSKGKYTSKMVILGMGVRGTPRRLGLPNEDSAKVAYNLIDPDEYKFSSIAIVGGGNAGLEAAQYLSKTKLKNKIHLIVRGNPDDAFSKANEQNQNLVLELINQKKVEVHYKSAIKVIDKETITISKGDGEVILENDYIFVFAGAEVPFKFLMSLGIEIDKAHGEKRKKGA